VGASVRNNYDLMLLDIAYCWTVSHSYQDGNERQPTFIPRRPPNGFRMYAVLLETGISPAGGTSSKIIFRMCGRLTKSPAFSLVCDSSTKSSGVASHHFDSQNKDLFILAVPHYLGQLYAFEVMTNRKGDCPPWFLNCIRVMCLDNKKCWKSDVSMWLRGDQKPYHIKASTMGAINTRSYFNKVFLQNHLWTFTWFRSLGSSFSSLNRWAIHWASLGFSMTSAHYFLYDEGLVENIDLQYVKTPSYNGNDVVIAALIASVVGVTLGCGLRICSRLQTGCNLLKWNRVDDKDDFSHMMKPEALDYAYGAVVQFDRKHESHFCTQQINHLTPSQIDILRHIAFCEKPSCNTKYGRKGCGTLDCPLDPLDDNLKDIILQMNNKETEKSKNERYREMWAKNRKKSSNLKVRFPEDTESNISIEDGERFDSGLPDKKKGGFASRLKAKLTRNNKKDTGKAIDDLMALDPSFGVEQIEDATTACDESTIISAKEADVQETCFTKDASESSSDHHEMESETELTEQSSTVGDDTEYTEQSSSVDDDDVSESEFTSCDDNQDIAAPNPSAGRHRRKLKSSGRNKKDPSCHLCQVPMVSARSE